jgi:high affinity sulfate transporter 1
MLLARRAGAIAPGARELSGYRRTWLRRDAVAGLTVAAYLVPQVMAYAGVAGLAPVAGLWAAVPAMAVYAVLGSSRQLSVGPESTTALLTAATIAPLHPDSPARYAALCAALAVLVGVICLIAWALRLGFVADLLSKPVLVGYLAGVAVIMIVGQLSRTTGVPVTGDGLLAQMSSFLTNLAHIHWPTVALSAAVLAFLFLVQVTLPRVPGPLVAVIACAGLAGAAGLADHGFALVGTMPKGLPPLTVPDVDASDVRALLLPALAIAVVAYTDNVLTARAFATRGHYEVDVNQELLALGVSNVGAGVVKGFPVSSSGSRTALGDAAGSRTQAYSLLALAVLLAVLLVGGPVLADIPEATLGAIIIYAACQLIDVAEFARIARFRRSEFVIALATFGGVLLLNILYGVLLAVGLSVADLLRRVARPHDAILGQVEGLAGMHDVDDYPTARTVPGLVVYRYDSPLFFANADDFKHRAMAAALGIKDPQWFLLNVEANVEVDITGLDAVEWLRDALHQQGIVLAMARVKQDLLDALRAHGLAERIGEERLFPTLPTALEGYLNWSADQQR